MELMQIGFWVVLGAVALGFATYWLGLGLYKLAQPYTAAEAAARKWTRPDYAAIARRRR